MPFKINISEKGKTFKLETDTEALIGKKIGDKIEGKTLKPGLEGYELEITGTSDKAGFPGKKNIEGQVLRKILLKKGWGMHNKKKGLRLKKTIRGNIISKDTVQINLKVIKAGDKKLEEILPKVKEGEKKEEKPEEKVEEIKEKPKEEKIQEEEEKKEEETKGE